MIDRAQRQSRPHRGVLALHIAMIALIVAPFPAAPAVITVDGQTGDTPGTTCDLVEAIQNAENDNAANADCVAGSGDDEIVLTVDVVLTDQFNMNQTGLPNIGGFNGALTIEGNDHTISRDLGSDPFRFFNIGNNGNLTLSNVVLTGGLVSEPAIESVGGAIKNQGTLVLTNTTVTANSASGMSPLNLAYGGGLYNLGTATITDSTFDSNTVEAIDVAAAVTSAGGAAISNGTFFTSFTPTLTLTATTISSNQATAIASGTAAIYGAGIYAAVGTATITNSTLSGNVAYSSGDDALALGGGIDLTEGDVTIRSTTVSSNSVDAQSGLYYREGPAGILFDDFGGSLNMYDSIVGNQYPLANCEGVGAPEDGGDNLSDDATCGTIPNTLTNLDAVLMDNGGPTQTHALLAASTAIDAAGTCGLAFDQRGVARPVDDCDSGSYESIGCQAADGDMFTIPDQTIISTEETFETCTSITLADVDVVGPGGHLILRTAGRVEIGNGFEVEVDAQLTVEIDSGIVMPASG